MANHAKCCVAVDDVFHEGGRIGFLLVHRLGGSPTEMVHLAEGLAQDGHTVACPVLFGHCGSNALLGATSWEHWYGSVRGAHEDLAKRCDTIVVVGLGVGAMLALHLAVEQPDNVHGVVLLAPTFWPNGWATPWRARLLRLIEHKSLANLFRVDERHPYGIKDDELRRIMLDEIGHDGRSRQDVLGRFGGNLLEVKWLARKVLPELARVSQPCLIVHPRHDDRTSLAASQLLQKRLTGIVDLVVLEDSYHLVTMDRQRAIVRERIQEYATALPRLVKQRPRPPAGSLPQQAQTQPD